MVEHPEDTPMENMSNGVSKLRENGVMDENGSPPNYASFAPRDTTSRNLCIRCCSSLRCLIEDSLSIAFFNYGKLVASHPCKFIMFCILLTSACGTGIINFQRENNVLKLWIPQDSEQR